MSRPGPRTASDRDVAPPGLRPAEVCRALLLALEASEGRRRRRKRDTRPDAIGLEIKRRLLEDAVRDDPDPDSFEAWLLARCAAAGPGEGATRAMAVSIRDEWRLSCLQTDFHGWLRRGAPSADRLGGGT